MTVFRAFIPVFDKGRHIDRDTLSNLLKILHDKIEVQISQEDFTALPLLQNNVADAVVIDATYRPGIYLPLPPKYHARKFHVQQLWESDMFFQDGVRYLTALEPRAMNFIRDIYIGCCAGETQLGPLCSSSVSIYKGRVPNPPFFLGSYGDGREVMMEGSKDYEKEILEIVSSITDRFAYTTEERIEMANYFR